MEDSRIIDVLRSWRGTRWMHGVSLKGYRTDCLQFIVSACKELGWMKPEYQTPVYNRQRALHENCHLISEEFDKWPGMRRIMFPLEPYKVGDILVYRTGKGEGHVGMYIGGGRMIHCSIRHGVEEIQVEHRQAGDLAAAWRREAE
jgi:cell wall-associated NlpC family hydrolase